MTGITRRDFLDGVACTIAAGMSPRAAASAEAAAEGEAPYPPARTGYLGSRPQDFAIAHSERDIAAITVNRWGHGYAYDMDPLFDDEATSKRETQLSREPVGRIHFAGTDAAWMAYAHWAMDSAQRAAQEILT